MDKPLTPVARKQIRDAINIGGATHASVAHIYGIPVAHVKRVLNGK